MAVPVLSSFCDYISFYCQQT